MFEVKTEIKSETGSQNIEDSSHLKQVKTDTGKSECSNSVTSSTNQDNKQSETRINDIVKTKAAVNGVQIKSTELKVYPSAEFEQVSPLSSPKDSEFSISSIESFEDEVENIIVCVGNEYAYQCYQDPKKGDLYKKDSYNAKISGSYKESVRRLDNSKFNRKNSRSSRVSDRSIKHSERSRSRDNDHSRYKYSSDKIRSSNSSKSYRHSRSWEKSRSGYTSSRSRHSQSWDKNKRYRESRSPPYRSRKRRRQSRSRSRSRSLSNSYNSKKLNLDKRGSSIKKRKLFSASPARNVGELLDRLKFPDNRIINRQRKKSDSPIPPPLPNSPPPSKPPPPIENNTAIPQPSLTVNNVSNGGLSLYQWNYQGNQHLHGLYTFQNPAVPSISVNNLPLVPGLENLPVHITTTGEQILHDMDGRPIPIGPNGRLLPVDMSGRLYPHIVFPYNNQAVPIYMTEDEVLRLPNGEPVPYGLPNQLPVNIDGSIIPIGPDSRPLYPCPNIPRQNPFISSQVQNPAIPGIDSVSEQLDQRNSLLPAVTEVKPNTTVKKRFNQAKLPSAVIQIETTSDLELKNRQTTPKDKGIENKNDLEKQVHDKKSEVSATLKTKSKADVQKPVAKSFPKFSAKVSTVNRNLRKKKLYENVDLPKLVEKFSKRVSQMKVRAIYQKKIQRNFKTEMKLPETEESLAILKTDNISGSGLGCDAISVKEPFCKVHSEKYPRTSGKNSSDPKDYELSAEEALYEKKFIETIHEAISLFAQINFNPPVFGRFLFSKSSTNFVNQSSPNESPLLKNAVELPFFSPESMGSQPKTKSSVKFRFMPQNDGKLPQKATVPSVSLSFAVQCDFTSKRIQCLHAKIEKLRKELFQCKNENAELTDLYKSVRKENEEKTEELSKVLKKIEEKNKIIRDLSQRRK